MPTLPALYVTGTSSYTSNSLTAYTRGASTWSAGSAIASNPHLSMDTSSAFDTTETSGDAAIGLAPGANTTGPVVVKFAMTNMPSDFLSMNTGMTFKWSAKDYGPYSDDTALLTLSIETPAGAFLASNTGVGPETIASFNGTSWSTTDQAQQPAYNRSGTFSYVDTTATKATWDSALIVLQFSDVKNKGSDSAAIIVVDLEFGGTYIAPVRASVSDGQMGRRTRSHRAFDVGALY